MTLYHIDRNIRPQVHDIGQLRLQPEVASTLMNGITLHVLNSGTAEVCRIGVALPGGVAENEKPRLFDIVANLLPEGTLSMPGAMLAENLESNGAWTQAGVHTHHTLLNLYCLNSRFENLLPLIRDMIFQPAFLPDATERILRTTASRIAVDQRKVEYLASKALAPIIYGAESPMAISPEPEEVMAVTPAQLHKAHKSRLDTGKMHIYLSGLVTDGMVKSVEQTFGHITTDVSYDMTEPVFPVITGREEVFTEMPGALQNAVLAAIPTPGRSHRDFISIRMAATALGGYFGSRLMTDIREDKGLTYGISAALYGYPENGYLRISTQTDCGNTPLVLEEIESEIERLKDPSTFTPDEVERLQKYLLSTLASTLDSPFTQMDFHQNTLLAGTPEGYFELQQQAIRNLTPETIATAALYFDTRRLITSVAGSLTE